MVVLTDGMIKIKINAYSVWKNVLLVVMELLVILVSMTLTDQEPLVLVMMGGSIME